MLAWAGIANASGIGIPERRVWHVCPSLSQAEFFAEMVMQNPIVAMWAWEEHVKLGLCFELTHEMMPQALVHRSQMGNESARVVRVYDYDADKIWYWVTIEPVIGEPPQ